MQEEFDISEGYSMNYLIHAVFIIGLGFAMIYFNWLIALIILCFGLFLLFAKTGVVFSSNMENVQAYKSFFGFKTGISYKVSDFKKVILKYTNEAVLLQSRGSSNVVRARTYDIELIKSNHKKIILHEFNDYKLAKKTFNILISQDGYTGTNNISEMQAAIVERRRKSRRR